MMKNAPFKSRVFHLQFYPDPRGGGCTRIKLQSNLLHVCTGLATTSDVLAGASEASHLYSAGIGKQLHHDGFS